MSNTAPLVSVIIPTMNRGYLASRAIESVLAQTYSNYEIIVVDDGSTDNSQEILATYKDRICFFQKQNGGLSSARNYGISHARGKYVAFLDDDDIWLPHKLEKQLAAIKHHNDSSVMCFSGFANFVLKSGERNFVTNIPRENIKESQIIENTFDRIFNHNGYAILPSTIIVKTEVIKKAGGFDESFIVNEDTDFYIRLSDYGTFLETYELLVHRDISEERGVSLTGSGNNRYQTEDWVLSRIRIFEKSLRHEKSMHSHLKTLISGRLRSDYSHLANYQLSRKEIKEAKLSLKKALSYRFSTKTLCKLCLISLPGVSSFFTGRT